MKSILVLSLSCALVCFACSSSDDGQGGGGSGQDAGPVTTCPAAAPAVGDSCDNEEMTCSYGDSYDPSCRDIFGCSGGEFKSTKWSGECVPEVGCPAEPPSGGCDPSQASSCHYAGATRCICSECEPYTGGPCVPLPSPEWQCSSSPGSGACPDEVPNWGAPCATEGAVCVYVSCYFDAKCEGGVWTWRHVAC